MTKKSKWDLPKESKEKNDSMQKTVEDSPADTDKEKVNNIEIEKEVETSISNITVNNPIVIQTYNEKPEKRTARYNVNIRKSPTDTENNIIGVVKIGEEIDILSVENGWAKIGDGKYVMIKYFD